MINPYVTYILGFAVSLLVYQFGWSEIYPPIRASLLLFLVVTFIAHFSLSRIWNKKKWGVDQKIPSAKFNPTLVTCFIYALWAADFVYEGGIPLVKILFDLPYDYRQFGVPSLHVFTVTFASFYTVYLFYLFLKTKERIMMVLYFVNFFAAVLIYSRSMLFFNLVSCVFLYLLTLEKIPYRQILLVSPAVILLFYFFGVVGTKRVSFESRVSYNTTLFLDNGKATAQFRSSFIPKEFFWPYFYMSSPMANLQVNINTYQVKPITVSRILEYINNELLFESFSKRVNSFFGIAREKENVIKEPFNVSTVYSRGYSYLGWLGMTITALVVLFLPLLYLKLVRHNPYQLIAVAILCTTYLFLSYDNTIRLMALGFQLVYPILFPMAEKVFVKTVHS
ncbi:MAG TPA: hypothetical protein VL728_02595 [Cyclobacteriaceae bacterium]|nr:hypothetical protein [Cyclobacteriaceae bacterium]